MWPAQVPFSFMPGSESDNIVVILLSSLWWLKASVVVQQCKAMQSDVVLWTRTTKLKSCPYEKRLSAPMRKDSLPLWEGIQCYELHNPCRCYFVYDRCYFYDHRLWPPSSLLWPWPKSSLLRLNYYPRSSVTPHRHPRSMHSVSTSTSIASSMEMQYAMGGSVSVNPSSWPTAATAATTSTTSTTTTTTTTTSTFNQFY